MARPYGVLLVGHGTRDLRGTDEFFQLGEQLVREMGASAIVCPCLLEFQEPTIRQAWRTLADRECASVVVAPLLLFSAGHAKSDIPGEVEAARRSCPGSDSIAVRTCRPISRQFSVIDAIRSRLRIAAERATNRSDQAVRVWATADPNTAVVMVGRGSRDVCASADMRVLSEVAVMGRDPVTGVSIADQFSIRRDALFTTFYAMAEPRLPETLDRIASSGRFERILVHPHLLFSGRLYDAILQQVDEASVRYPAIRFVASDYLGPTGEVARAIAARIQSVSRRPS